MPILTTVMAAQIARDLQDRLSKFVAATLPVVVPSNDTDGNPVLTFSADATPITGEKIVVIRVKPVAAPPAYDIFGNASTIYAPHVIQIVTEKNFAGTTDNVADILTPVELLPVFIECGRFNCQVEWYTPNNGTAPTTAGITGAPVGKWFPLYNPLSGQ